jgi:LysR family transcriptional regulator, transcription activator of glutamate synthase operon
MLHGVKVDELRWFMTVAERGNVTAAATELNVTQPTLTRALQRLEAEAGAALFDRLNRRLTLNRLGQLMYSRAQDAVSALDRAADEIGALRDPESGIVRLAVLHSMASWFAPEILRQYRTVAPRARWDLRLAPAHEIARLLEGSDIDVAITGPRPTSDLIGWHELRVEQLCLVVPDGHPMALRERISVAELAAEPIVTLGPEFGLRALTDRLFAAVKLTPKVVLETMEIPSIEGLVGAGLGVGIVPAPLRRGPRDGVRYVPLSDDGAVRSIGLAWRHGNEVSPAVRRFAQFVRATNWAPAAPMDRLPASSPSHQ